ncbi:N-acetyltransferase [Xenorhabdus mauleonii]|uniref:Acetyltransferase (GNAT) domain-containing protein n=1 Tax=Xenorhabdus mauleonii TaxID=351675 RepID=A0A1I3RUC5_9GAMM|nr:GNAT family N-acetyltransferase [Xenorhabdus mauleonii]PHM46405.1 N-acetyltransferase [Xenorhabdus mauleonii]SFJ50154.1 Acetyltransferase (GNAT) domain-containing protein [Xenorhabdus mauleonii]
MKNYSLFNNIKSLLPIGLSPKERYKRKYATTIREVDRNQMLRHLDRMNINTSDFDLTKNEYSVRQQSFTSVYEGIQKDHPHPLLSTLTSTNSNSGHRYFVCFTQVNIPVGIMVFLPGTSGFSYGKPDYIDYLLTHPGAQGIGSLLVEKAVESLTNEELRVNSKHYAEPFYERLGFKAESHNIDTISMTLIPKESPQWEKVNNFYRLKAYL